MGPKLLENIVKELGELLRGRVISKVHQPDERHLIFKVFGRGEERSLLVSTRPGVERLHLTTTKLANPFAPLRFCALLRSRISNALIEDVSVRAGESIAEITLNKKEVGRYKLVIELTGKSSNVI
ncbi:MAG: NFACT family protein, partial [Thermodesulfobacteriota bacterium]